MNRISGAILILSGCICSATAAALFGMAFGQAGMLGAGLCMFVQSYILIGRGMRQHDKGD